MAEEEDQAAGKVTPVDLDESDTECAAENSDEEFPSLSKAAPSGPPKRRTLFLPRPGKQPKPVSMPPSFTQEEKGKGKGKGGKGHVSDDEDVAYSGAGLRDADDQEEDEEEASAEEAEEETAGSDKGQ